MTAQQADGEGQLYDRAFLLSEGKRNIVMELWEVQKYGLDCYSDPEYVSIYGMPPAEWNRRGVRLLARTTVEAVRDKLGEMIGKDVASVIRNTAPATTFQLLNGEYKALLETHQFPSDHFIIAYLAPPWGDALNETTGLDLGRTKPPIEEIIDDFERIYKDNRILYVTQLHQNVEPVSLENVKRRFDWSDVRIYDINVEGMKHEVLPRPESMDAQPEAT